MEPRRPRYWLDEPGPSPDSMPINPHELPDTRDGRDYETLEALVDTWIASRDNGTILDAMAALEYQVRNHYLAGLEDNTNTDWRRHRRYLTQFERLAAAYASFENAETLRLFPELGERVRTIRNAVDAELIKYLASHPTALHQLKPRQFEELIAEILKSFGWDVELTPETKDGGYDILGATTSPVLGVKMSCIFECKKYAPQNKVGVEIARQLLYVKNDLAISHAMLITTSDFTSGVRKLEANRLDFDAKNFDSVKEWCRLSAC